MATHVVLTKLAPEPLRDPGTVGPLNRRVEDRIRQELPDVKWKANYVVLEP